MSAGDKLENIYDIFIYHLAVQVKYTRKYDYNDPDIAHLPTIVKDSQRHGFHCQKSILLLFGEQAFGKPPEAMLADAEVKVEQWRKEAVTHETEVPAER